MHGYTIKIDHQHDYSLNNFHSALIWESVSITVPREYILNEGNNIMCTGFLKTAILKN